MGAKSISKLSGCKFSLIGFSDGSIFVNHFAARALVKSYISYLLSPLTLTRAGNKHRLRRMDSVIISPLGKINLKYQVLTYIIILDFLMEPLCRDTISRYR